MRAPALLFMLAGCGSSSQTADPRPEPPGAPPVAGRSASAPPALDLGDYQVKLNAPLPSANDQFGQAVAGAGDVNGDGFLDVLVGAPQVDDTAANAGAAFLFMGDARGIQHGLTVTLLTDDGAAVDNLGVAVGGVGDLNGDGYADIAVGAPGSDAVGVQAGAVYVWTGSADGPVGPTRLTPADAGGMAGFALSGSTIAATVDVDGDGLADMLVGGPTQGSAGTVWVVGGGDLSVTATLTAADADSGDALGTAVAGGDLDGDGYAEVVAGAPDDDQAATNAGAVYVFAGGSGGPSASNQTKLTADDAVADDAFGTALTLAGDMDGDGFLDLAVGAYLVDGSVDQQGAIYVYAGSADGLDASAAVKVDAPDPLADAFFGFSLAGVGDLDGDGRADLLVGAPGASANGISSGAAYVFLGTGELLGSEAAAKVAPDEQGAGFRYGHAVASTRDVDGNGVPDFIVGAAGYVRRSRDTGDDIGDETGAAWLHLPKCYDMDLDGACADDDCDDLDINTFPGAAQLESAISCMRDQDDDGYGDMDVAADGLIVAGTDCDDADADIQPDATELCNGLDDDCDGSVDNGAQDAPVWAPDADGDQYTDNDFQQQACQAPDGMLTPSLARDCDDSDPDIHPGAAEIAGDGIDQDCSGADLEADPVAEKGCATAGTGASWAWLLALSLLGWRRRSR